MKPVLLVAALTAPLLLGCRTDGGDKPGDTGGFAPVDADGDGYTEAEGDCDDADAAVNPGAAEVCNGADDDCDGDIDEGATTTFYADADGDGFGDPDSPVEACSAPSGAVADATDCDDADAAVNPDAAEVCDEIDNNCDGDVDEGVLSTFYADGDGDGFGDPDSSVEACEAPSGTVADATDCDDTTAAAHPGAEEVCDEIDNDCDGDVDEEVTTTFWADADGDGHGDPALAEEACEAPTGYAEVGDDCDDADPAVNPEAAETCNGVDDDCDGDVDEGVLSTFYDDADGDGFGDPDSPVEACSAPSGAVADGSDCDDGDPAVNPDAVEICDEIDNDCDGDVDDADPDLDASTGSTFYDDLDGDGYGDAASPVEACEAPSGTVADDTDCDDGDPAVHPGATDDCDGVDTDCDGDVDEDSLDGMALISVDTNAGTIFEIDTATGAATAITSIDPSFGGAINTVAVDGNTALGQDYTDLQLVEVDVCDGTMSGLGAHGAGNTCGISWGPGGKLYGIDSTNDTLVEFDPTTGKATTIGSLGFDLQSCGLSYDCTNDRLVGAESVSDTLFTVDTTTGAATTLVTTDVAFGSVGIEYDPVEQRFLVSDGTELYAVDPTTGASTDIGPTGGTNIDDLVFYPECP